MILKRSFYQRATTTVARALLGKVITRHWHGKTITALIIETEAYAGLSDPASHAYNGQTNRNKAMFGPVGHSYVYMSYGIHHCLNIVSKKQGIPAGGVLIRAALVVQDDGTMKHVKGPGNIGKLLHLKLSDNGIDVTQKGVFSISTGLRLRSTDIQKTPRIGISKARENEWRYVIKKEAIEKIKRGGIKPPRNTVF